MNDCNESKNKRKEIRKQNKEIFINEVRKWRKIRKKIQSQNKIEPEIRRILEKSEWNENKKINIIHDKNR